MELIDEEDDVPRGHDLVEDGFEALFELPPVLGTGDDGGHIELDDLLVGEEGGDFPAGDALGQALHDGGLAHPGLAHEDGVVLFAAAEDLDHPLELPFPSDHGVKEAGGGLLHEVAAELPKLARQAGRGRADPRGPPAGREILPHRAQIHPVGPEDLGRRALALPQDGKKEVLGLDGLRAIPAGLLVGQFHHPLEPLSGLELIGRNVDAAAALLPLHIPGHPIIGEAFGDEEAADAASLLAQGRKKQVLRAHIAVAPLRGLLLGQGQKLHGLLGELLVHGNKLLQRLYRPGRPPPREEVERGLKAFFQENQGQFCREVAGLIEDRDFLGLGRGEDELGEVQVTGRGADPHAEPRYLLRSQRFQNGAHPPVGAGAAGGPEPHLAQREIHIVVDQKESGRRDPKAPGKFQNRLAGEVHERQRAEEEFSALPVNLAPGEARKLPVAGVQKPLEDPKAEVVAGESV